MSENKLEIKCELVNNIKDNGDKEVVINFGDSIGRISFNEDSQKSIKSLFGNLLKLLIENRIEIKLDVSKEEIKPSFLKDVSEEYIKQLNTELKIVKDHLNERFSATETINE